MIKVRWSRYKRIAVYIDNANIIHAPPYLEWFIDFEKLARYFNRAEDLVQVRLFDSIPEKEDLDLLLGRTRNGMTKKDYEKYLDRSERQRKFLSRAEKDWGVDVNLKPLRFIYDEKLKRFHKKGDCDVDLTVEAIRRRKKYDTLFLLSGDGDFVPLVSYLKQCQKQVVVMSTRGLIANILVDVADKYIDFRHLKKELFYKKFTP